MNPDKLYKNLILKYGINPYKYFYSKNNTHIGKGYNEFCGDQINLYVTKKKHTISNISFLGKSCAISTASTSLMIKTLEGKSLPEIKKTFFNFSNMFINNNFSSRFSENELILKNLINVKQYPSRVKCVTLPWNILYNMIIRKYI